MAPKKPPKGQSGQESPPPSPPPPPPPEVVHEAIVWIERGRKPNVEKRDRGPSPQPRPGGDGKLSNN
jgi:hypothetical protein